MERGTEYGLEQVYSVIDSRYRSGKPLIATTNLTLEELQHPQDTPHEMCIRDSYKAYYLQVYSYTISLAKNREIAEEITQNTFYKAVSTTSQFKGKSCLLYTSRCV